MLLHFETRIFYDISNFQNQDPLACLLALEFQRKIITIITIMRIIPTSVAVRLNSIKWHGAACYRH